MSFLVQRDVPQVAYKQADHKTTLPKQTLSKISMHVVVKSYIAFSGNDSDLSTMPFDMPLVRSGETTREYLGLFGNWAKRDLAANSSSILKSSIDLTVHESDELDAAHLITCDFSEAANGYGQHATLCKNPLAVGLSVYPTFNNTAFTLSSRISSTHKVVAHEIGHNIGFLHTNARVSARRCCFLYREKE